MKTRQYFILILALLLISACSQDMLSVFFDIPPPSAEELAKQRAKELAKKRAARSRVVDDEVTIKKMPPHKLAGKLASANSWKEAVKYLPKDAFGQPDWIAAMDKGIIYPRSHIGTDRINQPTFGFDFYLKGPSPQFDAWFPHSTHTRLLDCASCHPKVFKYRGTKITMKDIRAGKYCGTCHGKIAFPVDVACARCHTGMLGAK